MPYYITKSSPKCSGWAVVDAGEGYYGCHTTKGSAIKQAVAIMIATKEPFKGERAAVGSLKINDYVSWNPEDPEIVAQVVDLSGDYSVLRVFEEEDGVFTPTEKLMILNIMGLKKIQKPEMIAYESSMMEDSADPMMPELDAIDSEAKDPIVISDIDGTLLNGSTLNDAVYQYIDDQDADLFIVTGRPESERAKTIADLQDAEVEYEELIMNTGSSADSPSFKEETAKKLLESYDVILAVENNAETIQKYKDLGINTISPSEIPAQSEDRAVNLRPPAFMRAAARQGLKYYEQGLAGSGLVDATVREARAMAAGNVTADKWVRLRAWIARHLVDLDSPAANPSNKDYPSAGVVAHLLWGSGPSKRSAQRALDFADRVVTKLEEENRATVSLESKVMAKVEQRINTARFEVRESAAGMTFEGYAAIFDAPSEPLPFIEKIQRGAFNRSLKQARNDIKLLWNHDTGAVLGSTRAGTLKLVEDDRGLKVTGILPDTTQGRDAAVLLKRGDVDSMSFGFSVPTGGDTWNQDGSERTLKSVRLHEVSIVAYPAYTSTAGTTSVRGLDKIAERASVDADQLADAMLSLEEGKDLTSESADLLRAVINELAPTPSDSDVDLTGDVGMLELIKTKLKLMEIE